GPAPITATEVLGFILPAAIAQERRSDDIAPGAHGIQTAPSLVRPVVHTHIQARDPATRFDLHLLSQVDTGADGSIPGMPPRKLGSCTERRMRPREKLDGRAEAQQPYPMSEFWRAGASGRSANFLPRYRPTRERRL